jgi:hypothetical protein
MRIGTAEFRSPEYASFLTDADRQAAALERRIKAARQGLERFVVTAANLAAAEALIEASKPKEKA